MKEQLISFETAKLAKEKGFNYNCNNYTDKRDGNYFSSETTIISYKNYNDRTSAISRPTQSLLQKWLREKHNILIETIGNNTNKKFAVKVYFHNHINDKTSVGISPFYETYEEGLEEGLVTALKLI
jgi:hypothetical protein